MASCVKCGKKTVGRNKVCEACSGKSASVPERSPREAKNPFAGKSRIFFACLTVAAVLLVAVVLLPWASAPANSIFRSVYAETIYGPEPTLIPLEEFGINPANMPLYSFVAMAITGDPGSALLTMVSAVFAVVSLIFLVLFIVRLINGKEKSVAAGAGAMIFTLLLSISAVMTFFSLNGMMKSDAYPGGPLTLSPFFFFVPVAAIAGIVFLIKLNDEQHLSQAQRGADKAA